MNKEEFEHLDKLAADALNEIGNEVFDRVDILKIGQLLRINKTFLDIARQLTRIADQGEKLLEPTTLEKLDRLNLFLKHAIKEDRQLAPDALVEAVKDMMSDSECYCPENVAYKGLCGFCRVQSALAAHEKAVR